jgi:hypothetical protein
MLGGVPKPVDAVMGYVDSTTFGLKPATEAVGKPYFIVDYENAHRPSMNGSAEGLLKAAADRLTQWHCSIR